jgi:hypothetical protein
MGGTILVCVEAGGAVTEGGRGELAETGIVVPEDEGTEDKGVDNSDEGVTGEEAGKTEEGVESGLKLEAGVELETNPVKGLGTALVNTTSDNSEHNAENEGVNTMDEWEQQGTFLALRRPRFLWARTRSS